MATAPTKPRVVLALEQALSMSYATLRLVHQGFRVVRIEATPAPGRESRGDPNRYIGRVVAGEDRHSYYVAPNVGKQAVALNLKRQEGRELLLRLVRELPADVFCTNTMPSRHTELGMDYETLAAERPELVWCCISTMGPAQPDVPGYDPMLQALCGYMDLTGYADGPPLQCGPPLIDLKAGDEAFLQVMPALAEREKTGRGKRIDISMAQAAVSWLHTFLPMLDMGSPPAELRRVGNEHRQFIPVNSYRTRDGYVYVAIGSDAQFLAQRDFNRALAEMGLPGRNSRVIVPALGGAFGTGLDTHAYEYIAILLARATGQPVKIVYTREEEFAYLSPRQCAVVRIEQGCDRSGRLTFRDLEVLQDNGAYTSWGATYPGVMMLPATSLYRVPAVRFEVQIVYTNNTYCQAMRGYGNPELTWAVESNLDELAEAADMDAFDLRRINCNQAGDTTPMGFKIGTCGLAECLEQTAGRLGWREKRGKNREKRRGVGMASLIHVGGSGRIYRSDASGVILRLDDFGNVYVYAGGVEMGQGHHAALAVGVAEYVGVRPENVVINQTDTATCPWDVGTHASRGAFAALSAVRLAAAKLRERLFELALPVYTEELRRALGERQESALLLGEVRKDRLELAEGQLFLKEGPLAGEPWARVELGKVLRGIHFRPGGQMLTEEAFYDPPSELADWEKGRGDMSATYAFGTQGVEVEVDVETGDVRLLRVVAVHDVGRVLHPQALRGQIYGALAQGIGYALYEEVRTERGRVLNPSFTDYKPPTAGEMAFPIEVAFVETDDPAGPFGAKGVGEPGLVPTAPAIANAVYDAIGVRIRDLPITPEKIVAALREQARTQGEPR